MSGLQLGVALGIFLLIVYKIFIKPLNNSLKHLPAPEQGPAHKRLLVEPNGDRLAEWAETIPNDGFIRYQGIFNSSKVLVTDPNAFNEIFTTQCYSFIKPPPISNLIRSVLGNGIVVTEGDAHKSQKKAIQPAFKVQNLRNFYPIFERKVEELLDILSPLVKKSTADGTSLDLGTRLHQATLDMIGLASFGKDFSCMKDPSNKLASNYMLGFVPSASAQKYRLLALFLPEAILNRVPLKRNQELRTAVTAVRECASDEIEKRYAAMEKLEKQPSGADSNDILGTVMTESGVTDKEALINQSLTILGAGHDTIHVSIQGAIWELVKDQKIQDRLRSEVRQYYESGSSDIDSLPYLQAVLDETLRLHHAVPMMHRRNIEDVVVAGQAFPKGTNFKFSFRAFNRSPRLWKSNPEQFDPQRWMEDPALGGAKNKNAFMTFSSGARICIGQRFARAELKYLLAGLVAKYKFTWAGTGKDGKEQELTLEHGTTSRMIGGLWVKMEPVEGQ